MKCCMQNLPSWTYTNLSWTCGLGPGPRPGVSRTLPVTLFSLIISCMNSCMNVSDSMHCQTNSCMKCCIQNLPRWTYKKLNMGFGGPWPQRPRPYQLHYFLWSYHAWIHAWIVQNSCMPKIYIYIYYYY